MGVLVDPSTIFRSAVDRLRAAGIPNPERHVVDPSSPAAQQAMQQKQEADQAAQQAQAATLDRTLGIEEAKVKVTRQNKVDEVEFDYHELDVKTESEEAMTGAKGVIELSKIREQGATANAIEDKRARGAEGGAAGAGKAGA